MKAQILDYSKQIKDKKHNITKEIPEEIKNNIEIHSDISKNVINIKTFMELNKKEIQSLHQRINNFNIQKKLGEYVDSLREGKPCPLCGALEHPDILDVEDVSQHIQRARLKMGRLEEIDNLCQKILDGLRDVRTEINTLRSSLDQDNKKLEIQRTALEEHLKKFSWDEYKPDDDSRIEIELRELKPLQDDIRSLEKTLNEIEEKKESATETYNELKETVSDLKTQLISKSSVKSSLLNQLKFIQYKEGESNKNEVQNHIHELNQEIDQIKEEHKKITKQREILLEKKHKFEERIENTKKSYVQTSNKLTKIESDLEKLVKESPYNNLDEIKIQLENKIDISAVRKKIEKFNRELYKAREDVTQLKEKTEGKKFDSEAYEKLLQELDQLDKGVQDIRESLGGEKAELKNLRSDMQKKKQIEMELDGLEKRAENLRTLKNLFKGSGFVNYVSSVYLHNLCNAANERFIKLTRQQLKLELNENNEFEVRDFLNNGKTRSVKTLSGGQTFQASLSLALALSESVQQQRKNQQNFFFLDEGFGSLDKESLQIVFDTLKSLRKENRIVGVISHVDDLQQEIDIYIRVKNDIEKGSLIETSWEN
ncbi:MAG: hypothetical protein GF364_02510 [Candidatus Lokiarchaeota archaeon]|nr:hypothetical protein [Candidatus Lokiarchaeota archaeon]